MNTIYKGLFKMVIILSLLGLAGLGLYAMREIPVLPYIILIVTGILCFLTHKTFDTFKDYKYPKTIFYGLMMLSIICSVLIILHPNGDKAKATITNLFIEGKIVGVKYYEENERGYGEYVTYQELKPFNTYNYKYIELIDWALLILTISVPIINFYWIRKNEKLNKI